MQDKPPEYDTVESVSLAVMCTECRLSFLVHAEHAASQPVHGAGAGVVERGFRCPNCKHFYRAGFDSPALSDMRSVLQRARGDRRKLLGALYMRAYDEFQKKMSDKLNESAH